MISTEITLEAEICWAEPTLLMRVLDNLYSNAVHYGKESGNIWIRSRQVGQRCKSTSPIAARRSPRLKEP